MPPVVIVEELLKNKLPKCHPNVLMDGHVSCEILPTINRKPTLPTAVMHLSKILFLFRAKICKAECHLRSVGRPSCPIENSHILLSGGLSTQGVCIAAVSEKILAQLSGMLFHPYSAPLWRLKSEHGGVIFRFSSCYFLVAWKDDVSIVNRFVGRRENGMRPCHCRK